MRYQNRVPAEGINVDEKSHPLKEFLILTGLIALGAGLIVAAMAFGAQYLARYVPFKYEQQLAARFEGRDPSKVQKFQNQEAALRAIVARLQPGLDLPPGMEIKVHYLDDKVVNAFATLGGHVFIYRGLLEKIPNENALAFVLAHEIAHVKHRHPAQALGRSVAIGMALMAVSAGGGGGIADRPLGAAGLLTGLKFSRDHESEADETALRALVQGYGDGGGAMDLFKLFTELADGRQDGVPAVLLTHPLSRERGDTMRARAREKSWAMDGQRLALPEDLRKLPEQKK